MSQHLESMGDKWFTLLKSPDLIPGVIGTTVAEGGTRPIWRIEEGERETFLMAWPRESLLRAGVVFAGRKDARLDPAGVFPFLEGFANSLTVVETYP